MSFLDGGTSREAYNERIKLISQTMQNLSVAVVIALFGGLFTAGFSAVIVYAAIVAISLFAIAYKVLGNLEEDET
jgi:Kef-type K+ transport system membrane component KefB